MTDPMELVGRLEAYRPTNEWGDPVHHVIADEAAACIREMVEERDALKRRLDRWEPKTALFSASCGMRAILDKQASDPTRRLNPLPPSPGAEA